MPHETQVQRARDRSGLRLGVDLGVDIALRSQRRDDATTYQYAAPSVPYEATLEMAPNGFVKTYPGLWAMES